jgi:integrase
MARRRKQPGTGYIVERPSKKHGVVYQIRWRINGGKADSEIIGPDRSEAEQALALKLAEINLGTYRERHEATFHEFASKWFADHKANLRPSGGERVRIDLEVHLVPFFGDYLLSQIGPELIARYKAEKVAERRAGDARIAGLEAGMASHHRRELAQARRERGLSNVSINKTLTLLRQVLAAGVSYGYIDRNPVDDVSRLKVTKKSQPFVQLDQIPALVDATPSSTARSCGRCSCRPANRRSTRAALERRGVPLRPPRLNIARTWDPESKPAGADHRGIEGPVKTGEEGSVAIGEHLLKTLLDHKDGSRFAGQNDLVFPTSTGRHQNPSNFRRRVLASAVERANARLRVQKMPTIPAITPHSLRHTYCSLLIAQGEDLATVADHMRHADQSTTLKIYTHVMKHRRRGVAERLDRAVFGSEPHPNASGVS